MQLVFVPGEKEQFQTDECRDEQNDKWEFAPKINYKLWNLFT